MRDWYDSPSLMLMLPTTGVICLEEFEKGAVM